MTFQPDYKNVQDAAFNRKPKRLPLYEHLVHNNVMEAIIDKKFSHLYNGNLREKDEYFTHFCEFYKRLGYDAVSFECCIGGILPNGGLLGGHGTSVIQSYADFEKYPWDELCDMYFEKFGDYFRALGNVLPPGMKAVGGVGNGIFEAVQEIMGYEHLAIISYDDPDLYAGLFKRMGDISFAIWERFLKAYGDSYCVLRFGDDLGFKTNTLLPADDIRKHIILQYRRIVDLVHSNNKPFLLHSCGNLFDIMPDIINNAKINAKHSNEDIIARFPVWVQKFGSQVAHFGGIDTDALCSLSPAQVREYVNDVLKQCEQYAGAIAFGSGNSIPGYINLDNYLEMSNTVRTYRGDF